MACASIGQNWPVAPIIASNFGFDAPFKNRFSGGTYIECGVSYAKIRKSRTRITLHLFKRIEYHFSQASTHTLSGAARTIQVTSYSLQNRVSLEGASALMINIGKEEEEGNTVSSETDKEMNAVRSRPWNMPDQSSE